MGEGKVHVVRAALCGCASNYRASKNRQRLGEAIVCDLEEVKASTSASVLVVHMLYDQGGMFGVLCR